MTERANGLVVRTARPEDRAGIEAVTAAATAELRRSYRPIPSRIGADRDRDESLRLVARLDDAVVGTLDCHFGPGTAHLRRLAVDPRHRRRGIARALVDRASELARRRKLGVSIETIRETGNVPIFERMGFRVVSAAVDDRFASDVHRELVSVRLERDPGRSGKRRRKFP